MEKMPTEVAAAWSLLQEADEEDIVPMLLYGYT